MDDVTRSMTWPWKITGLNWKKQLPSKSIILKNKTEPLKDTKKPSPFLFLELRLKRPAAAGRNHCGEVLGVRSPVLGGCGLGSKSCGHWGRKNANLRSLETNFPRLIESCSPTQRCFFLDAHCAKPCFVLQLPLWLVSWLLSQADS